MRLYPPAGYAHANRLLSKGQVVHLHPCDEIVAGATCEACGGNAPFVVVSLDRMARRMWVDLEPAKEQS